MKLRQKINALSLLLLCTILLLGGCTRESSGSGSGQASGSQGNAVSDTEQRMAYKDIRYLPEFTDTSDDYNANASEGIGFLDDTFYLMKWEVVETDYGYSIGACQVIARLIGTGEEKVLLDSADAGGEIVKAAVLKEGSVIALLRTSDNGCRLCKVDAEGQEIFSQEYPDITDAWRYSRFAADAKGRCCLETQEGLLLFDEQGRASGKIDLAGKSVTNITCSGSGTVYIYDWAGNQLIPIDFQTASLGTESYQVPIRVLRAIGTASGADFYCPYNGVKTLALRRNL